MLSSSRRAMSFSQRSWSSFQKSLSWDFSKSFPPCCQVLLVWRGVRSCARTSLLHCTAPCIPDQQVPIWGHLCPFPSGTRGILISLTLDSLLPLHRLTQNVYSLQNHMKLEQWRENKNLIFCSLFYLIILQLGFKGLTYLSCFMRFIVTFCTVPPAPQRE